jgi:hypothetical protein
MMAKRPTLRGGAGVAINHLHDDTESPETDQECPTRNESKMDSNDLDAARGCPTANEHIACPAESGGATRMLIDSGANCVTFREEYRHMAITLRKCRTSMETCDGSSLQSSQERGCIEVVMNGSGSVVTGLRLVIEDAIFSPTLRHNVMGATQLDLQAGVSTLFHGGKTILFHSRSIHEIPSSWTVLADESMIPMGTLSFWLNSRCQRSKIVWSWPGLETTPVAERISRKAARMSHPAHIVVSGLTLEGATPAYRDFFFRQTACV